MIPKFHYLVHYPEQILRVGPMQRMCTKLQVLDEQGHVLPGLYAVGQNGLGGMILWSHGLHIAWALTSGRLAGAAIMRDEEAAA